MLDQTLLPEQNIDDKNRYMQTTMCIQLALIPYCLCLWHTPCFQPSSYFLFSPHCCIDFCFSWEFLPTHPFSRKNDLCKKLCKYTYRICMNKVWLVDADDKIDFHNFVENTFPLFRHEFQIHLFVWRILLFILSLQCNNITPKLM